VVNNLTSTYQDFITQAHNANLLVYGVPILPFKRNAYYSADHESARQTLNNWIRTSNKFDSVIDLDAAVRDPADAAKLLSTYDSGDGLHLNKAGYQRMADAIDLTLFTQ
jgi:lysophospholipase L1-like esterase